MALAGGAVLASTKKVGGGGGLRHYMHSGTHDWSNCPGSTGPHSTPAPISAPGTACLVIISVLTAVAGLVFLFLAFLSPEHKKGQHQTVYQVLGPLLALLGCCGVVMACLYAHRMKLVPCSLPCANCFQGGTQATTVRPEPGPSGESAVTTRPDTVTTMIPMEIRTNMTDLDGQAP